MSYAIYYLSILPQIRAAAGVYGYVVGLHGSIDRDFDLVLVPWTKEAQAGEDVIEAIRETVHGSLAHPDHEPKYPRQKPHGRLCWAIQLGGGAYLNVSVMPRV